MMQVDLLASVLDAYFARPDSNFATCVRRIVRAELHLLHPSTYAPPPHNPYTLFILFFPNVSVVLVSFTILFSNNQCLTLQYKRVEERMVRRTRTISRYRSTREDAATAPTLPTSTTRRHPPLPLRPRPRRREETSSRAS
jgi:hypothetical protein